MIQAVWRVAGRHGQGALGRSPFPRPRVRCRGGQSSGGGGALRGQRGESQPLAGAGAEARRRPARAAERRSPAARIEAQAGLILALLAAMPDITVKELRAALAARGHAFGYGTLQRFLPGTGSRAKKTAHASEQDRPTKSLRKLSSFSAGLPAFGCHGRTESRRSRVSPELLEL